MMCGIILMMMTWNRILPENKKLLYSSPIEEFFMMPNSDNQLMIFRSMVDGVFRNFDF